MTFPKIYLGLIFFNFFFFFFQNSNSFFAVSALFHKQVLFLYVSYVRKMNISLIIILIFESRRVKKNLFDFSNNTFPTDCCYKLISLYMGNLSYSFTLKFNDHVEIWWHHQIIHVTIITILVLFERSYIVPHLCKVS